MIERICIVCRQIVLSLLLLLLAGTGAAAQTPRSYAAARTWMVESSVAAAGIKHPAILAAMRAVPRHEFVPDDMQPYAYLDAALPIGEQQTISPPYIVAWMTEQLDPQPTDRVLEIGTGSGYQAAVLSRLVAEVYTIEIQEPLAKRSRQTIERLGYKNVHPRFGDGFAGWAEHAPFDKIIVTCSPEKVPAPLVEQLREGGRILIPVGERFQQNLCLLTKQDGQLVVETREPTYFVPMTGRADSLRTGDRRPLTPLANGDFEQLLEPGKPAAWYYLRQATMADGGPRGEAGQYLLFSSRVPGTRSQAMQSFGVDGRQVRRVIVSAWVRGDDIRPAPTQDNGGGQARMVVSFFDDQRRVVSEQGLGPWRGSFDWRPQTGHLDVPREARGATLTVGLFGATGSLGCDHVEVRPIGTPGLARRP